MLDDVIVFFGRCFWPGDVEKRALSIASPSPNSGGFYKDHELIVCMGSSIVKNDGEPVEI